MDIIAQLKRDFEEFKDSCLGVVLYGSYAKGTQTKRSDIDVCLIKPKKGTYERVLEKLGGKYDVKIFEDLPLYLKIEIIKNYKVIHGNELEISEYFYHFRKLWKDMEKRIKENQFSSVKEKVSLRRRANEKAKILGEA